MGQASDLTRRSHILDNASFMAPSAAPSAREGYVKSGPGRQRELGSTTIRASQRSITLREPRNTILPMPRRLPHPEDNLAARAAKAPPPPPPVVAASPVEAALPLAEAMAMPQSALPQPAGLAQHAERDGV